MWEEARSALSLFLTEELSEASDKLIHCFFRAGPGSNHAHNGTLLVQLLQVRKREIPAGAPQLHYWAGWEKICYGHGVQAETEQPRFSHGLLQLRRHGIWHAGLKSKKEVIAEELPKLAARAAPLAKSAPLCFILIAESSLSSLKQITRASPDQGTVSCPANM